MISVPERRNPIDEFLNDNNIDMPTVSTVVDNGDSSVVINERPSEETDNGLAETHVDPWTASHALSTGEQELVESVITANANTEDFTVVNTQEESTPQPFSDTELHDIFDSNTVMQQAMDDALALPVNKIEHADDDTTMRFSGAAWFEAIQNSTIILAGVGGIGSNLLYNLARMKPKQIFIYDDDTVEEVNLAGQMYSTEMIGMKKVDAMNKLAIDFSNYHGIQAIPQKFTMDTQPSDIMICGFDNMEARMTFFDSWFKHVNDCDHKDKCLFIDGRLEMERFQVFCLRGDDSYSIKKYMTERLFPSSEAEETVCSMKQTAYCANMIGSVMTNLFVNFVANALNPEMPRSLPYFTYYDANFMQFKTED